MLTSLLPGLRDIRAPLAAGYLWLLAIWLLLAEHVPERSEATGHVLSLYRLDDVFTAVGLGVALSFVAYVLGVLSQGTVGGWLSRSGGGLWVYWGWRKRDQLTDQLGSMGHWVAFGRISQRAARSLLRGTATRLSRLSDNLPSDRKLGKLLAEVSADVGGAQSEVPIPREWPDDPRDVLSIQLLSLSVLQESQDIASRLIGKERELYTAQDRLESEAEFREAIVVPLLALTMIAAVAVESHDGWFPLVFLGGLSLAILIWGQAGASRRERNDLLIDAWFQGRVEAPVFERLFESAGVKITPSPTPPHRDEDQPDPVLG